MYTNKDPAQPKRDRDTEENSQKKRRQHKVQGRGWRDVATGQGSKKADGHCELREVKNGLSP